MLVSLEERELFGLLAMFVFAFLTGFNCRIEKQLEDIAASLNISLTSLESRLKSEGFKSRVLQVFRAWEEWAVYPKDLLHKLKSTFLGIQVSFFCFKLVLRFLRLVSRTTAFDRKVN